MVSRTDLHTHFAGVLSADELVELGLEHGINLDAATAKRLGIVNNHDGAAIPLSSLDEKQMTTLKAALEIDPAKQSLFDDLDAVYANRAFITKHPDMFIPQIERIAQSYAEQGITYTELSYAGVIDNPELIRQLHENLLRIEEETGVKIRFLGALWRHSDAEWNLDEADRLKKVLQSPYVVGIDVMGHEKNPIRDIKDPIQEVVKFAAENIPGCAIRMHAGENPYYSAEPSTLDAYNFNNAYEAVQIADEARRNPDGTFHGKYGNDIQIRIGHGRYGLQPETVEFLAEKGAISELCLSSNLLLNHADHFKGPFNLYAKHGISYVLGSDGYGMYNTTMPNEYALAVKAGMTPAARADLERTEDAVIAKDAARFDAKMTAWQKYEEECKAAGKDPFNELGNVVFSTSDGKQRWSPDVSSAKEQAVLAHRDALLSSLEGIGVNTDSDLIQYMLQEHNVILFSGASKSSWKNIPEDQQQKITETMRSFINELDGRKDVIVTGGTDYGFEAVIHRLVEERNRKLPAGARINVVGALTLEANISEIRPGSISHAVVLNYGNGFAHSWMDQSPALMDMVSRLDAQVVMAGGGQVIRDMIVDAAGRGFFDEGRAHLFEGINGASGEKAGEYPQSGFSSAGALKRSMSGKPKNIARTGKRNWFQKVIGR